ncbi:sigma-54-dependent Fis family transcriptional regulator [bacterium]|nr:sigma-54-dependent Fis family transcriptional regulator [bacterium]
MCAKILVVDDEISIRKILFDLLERERYYVELASSAEEALEKIKETTFDLIISDIRMPGMDGFELLKKIRTMNVDSAVIFITGYGSVESAVEAIKLGVVDYIEKPFRFGQFKNLVSQILNELYSQRAIAEDKLLVYTLSRAIFDNNQE